MSAHGERDRLVAAAESGDVALLAEHPGPLDLRSEPYGWTLLHTAALRLGWSMRAYHRVLRVARTIADVEGVAAIAAQHVAEAIQYRRATRTAR